MNHWDGVLRWFESQITNGIPEGFNSLIQSARAKARGYRTHKNFTNMAHLILGKLDLRLPTENDEEPAFADLSDSKNEAACFDLKRFFLTLNIRISNED